MMPLRPTDVAPDDLDAPFWAACRDGRFLVHRCMECGRAYWPASTCLDHGAAPMRWDDASGRGVVHTYTIVHHAYRPDLADRLPYVVAVVQLDEGPFFHTNIVGCEPAAVHVDMRVRATYAAIDDDTAVAYFTPDGPSDLGDRSTS